MKYIPILLPLLLLVSCAAKPESASYRQISMEDAVHLMAEEEGYIILDVRRADEFAAGHIPGTINVANESISTDDISELPDQDQLILVYCRSGNHSKQHLRSW